MSAGPAPEIRAVEGQAVPAGAGWGGARPGGWGRGTALQNRAGSAAGAEDVARPTTGRARPPRYAEARPTPGRASQAAADRRAGRPSSLQGESRARASSAHPALGTSSGTRAGVPPGDPRGRMDASRVRVRSEIVTFRGREFPRNTALVTVRSVERGFERPSGNVCGRAKTKHPNSGFDTGPHTSASASAWGVPFET